MTCARMLNAGCSASLAETVAFSPQQPARAPNRQFNVEWRAVHFADTHYGSQLLSGVLREQIKLL